MWEGPLFRLVCLFAFSGVPPMPNIPIGEAVTRFLFEGGIWRNQCAQAGAGCGDMLPHLPFGEVPHLPNILIGAASSLCCLAALKCTKCAQAGAQQRDWLAGGGCTEK